jgi:hypothetical protein
MSNVQETLHELRRIVNEQREPSDSLLMASDNWERFVKQGDNFLEAVQGVADLAAAAAGTQDEMQRRRLVSDVGAAVRKVTTITNKAYGLFAEGRENLYEAAQAWKIPTRRKGVGKPVTSISGDNDTALATQLQGASESMPSGVHAMLDLGAAVFRKARKASAATPEAGEEQKSLVDAGLDFRDAVSVNLFARTNGVMRRVVELSNRAWAKARYEETALSWVAPWDNDPELGGREVI